MEIKGMWASAPFVGYLAVRRRFGGSPKGRRHASFGAERTSAPHKTKPQKRIVKKSINVYKRIQVSLKKPEEALNLQATQRLK